jgi:hemolysin activation/secretion protein
MMCKRSNPSAALSVILVAGMTLPASTVFAVSSPSTVNPAQIEKRFEKPLEPVSKPKAVQVPQSDAGKMPENADQIQFILKSISLEGVSVFDSTDLEPFYKDLLDRQVSLKELYLVAEKLTAHYGNAGYLLSRAIVPPQTIESGNVTLKVIEGYVDDVVINGVDGLRPDIFDHYKAQLTASRPLHSRVLERFLLLANDLPGVRFKSVLNPSKTNVGAATLVMDGEQTPWQGLASLDNRGSESSGPWQLLIEGTANNLFGRLDTTTLRYATVANERDELQYWQLMHSQVLNGEGLKLGLDFNHTNSEPGGDIYNLLDVETRGHTETVSLNYPYIRSREENFSVNASFSFRESDTLQLGVLSTRDKLRVLRLSAIYDKADDIAGGGVSVLSGTLSQGVDMADAQVQSRLLADADFTHLGLTARRIQQLENLGKEWSLDIRLQAQYANETLPSPEQFGLGGENSVRGYEPAEWTGDSAFTGSAELRYQMPVEWDGTVQLYSFYDYGKIWNENEANLPLIEKTLSVDSAGVGTRVTFPQDLTLNVELTKPFDEHFDGDAADWELYGRLTWQF